MGELLFIKPIDIAKTTILGGNVQIEKYSFCIYNAQLTVIEPLLGSELYDKIVTDVTNDTLSGDYLTLYTKFIQPITKNEAVADYIEISGVMVNNGGIYKHQADNAVNLDSQETDSISQKWHSLAQVYVDRFYKWICKNPLTEYKTSQDEVNASKDIKTDFGWYI